MTMGASTGGAPLHAHVKRSGVAALYVRVAKALEESARLGELHAAREQSKDRATAAEMELAHARRARDAAHRGRALASTRQ
jgi:hypothetical protein